METPIAILHLLPCLIDSSGWQDGVPETIKLLRNAGINVWMLTGDKQNTAIQIGLLCNLITSGTVLFARHLVSFKFNQWPFATNNTSCLFQMFSPLVYCNFLSYHSIPLTLLCCTQMPSSKLLWNSVTSYYINFDQL